MSFLPVTSDPAVQQGATASFAPTIMARTHQRTSQFTNCYQKVHSPVSRLHVNHRKYQIQQIKHNNLIQTEPHGYPNSPS